MNAKLWKDYIMKITCAMIFLGNVFLFACAADWQRDVTDHSIRFDRLRQAENGWRTGKIDKSVDYQGYRCQAGWIKFYEDWGLRSCILDTPVKLGDVNIPAGAWVEFNSSGNIATVAFPENINIQQYECIGTHGEQKGYHTAFYPSGQLRYFFTPDDVNIAGIPCKGGWIPIIGLHENGRVSECTLAESLDIDGITYKRGQKITLTPDGVVTEKNQ